MGRAPCCDKANVKKGPWSPEEDAELKAYIEENGTGGNWIALPQKIGLKRCGKSCRLRWLNYLRPNLIHGQFSEREDQIICSLYISIGSRWSIIAAQLPGRTDNDIKNYWNTKLKKKLFGRQRDSSNPRRLSINQEIGREEPRAISAAALERIQLHMQLQGLDSPLSFYNNPALWPKYHPLGDMNLQSQKSNSTTAIQGPILTSLIEPSHKTMINHGMITNSMNANAQEKLDGSPLYYSSSSTSAAISSDNSNSNFNSMASSLQVEFEGLFSGKNHSSGGQEDHNLADLDCFKGINGEEHDLNWWTSNGFDEKSCSWGSVSAVQQDSMFHEYVTGYDL